MEENANKFMDKMKELLAFAKKKKNVLEYQEINDFLGDIELEAGQIEKIYEFLESNGVDILRVENFTEEEDDALEPDILLDDEEVEDYANIDMSVPEGVSLEDPVRMYLKEIGKVPLLSADKKWNWHSVSKKGTRQQRSVCPRQTCVWLSASQSVMWAEVCSFLI